MGKKPDNPDSIFTLPMVVGVIIVVGGIGALVASGLFVYRAHAVNAETHRIQASLQADLEQQGALATPPLEDTSETADAAAEPPVLLTSLDGAESDVPTESESEQVTVTALKPGARLHAQRPTHWDQAEIIDILEDHKIKVRWLSGEPGEAVIATDLVRGESP